MLGICLETERLERLDAISRDRNGCIEPGLLERSERYGDFVAIVLDEQNRGSSGHVASFRGSENENRAPSPSFPSAHTRPP